MTKGDRPTSIGILSWFIARRYLISHERKALASVITAISVTGVAVGVAALIVVIGVMDGARVHLFGKMANLIPHLKISPHGEDQLAVTPELLDRIRKDPAVVFVEPVLESQAVVQAAKGTEAQKDAVAIIGIDDLKQSPIYKDTIRTTGSMPQLAPKEILLGSPLADKIQAKVDGTAIVILLGQGGKNAKLALSPGGAMKIKGFFDTGFYAFDSQAAFVSTQQFRDMFGARPGTASYLYVRLKEPFQAEKVRERLNLWSEYNVQTWVELNGDFFSAIKMEKISLFIILLLIILVAAFNIIGTLVLMVIEKTREVGILRAIGASEGLIMRIFLLDGVSIGAMGTLLGVIIGSIIGLLIPAIKINMPPKVYNFDHLPVEINPWTVAIIVVSSLTISTLAALIPARQAARLNPVEALRYD